MNNRILTAAAVLICTHAAAAYLTAGALMFLHVEPLMDQNGWSVRKKVVAARVVILQWPYFLHRSRQALVEPEAGG